MDDKSLSLVIRDAKGNGKKALRILREYHLLKGKPKVISLYTELTSLRRLESHAITDYIIRAENISNTLKEAGEVISNRLLIAMALKGSPPNFKLFTTVIIQKKTLTFSEFKVCLRIYEETEHMCYPQDESNNILQMKTTFKKAKPRNKLQVSTHSHDYKSTNYYYNNYQKPQHNSKDYNISLQGRQILFVTFVRKKAIRFSNAEIKDEKIFVRI